ncbi:hypothetical protein [Leptospira licerasiae]|uniref:hypothetical protein n=1 Tax=Leptospira licerasiae TaxID=447106 RepID=UPI001084649F|nr:hypothetical protein [Leptospira licerasiae]TGM88854.1 hypothetical protein EHR05_11645 [Leptospira licerasiae]
MKISEQFISNEKTGMFTAFLSVASPLFGEVADAFLSVPIGAKAVAFINSGLGDKFWEEESEFTDIMFNLHSARIATLYLRQKALNDCYHKIHSSLLVEAWEESVQTLEEWTFQSEIIRDLPLIPFYPLPTSSTFE